MSDGDVATARPRICIRDGLLHIDDYPDEDGDLEIMTANDGEVMLNAYTEGDNCHAEAAITFDPETAEAVAELLEDYAVLARSGVQSLEAVRKQ